MAYLSKDEINAGILNNYMSQGSNIPSNEERTFGGTLKDIGVSLAKGGVGTVQGAIGLADIVTPGQLGKAVEENVVDLNKAQEYLEEQYTPAQKAANARVEAAQGFLPTLGAMIQNPSTIGHAIVESAPSMVAGGFVGKGLLAANALRSGLAAGAIGEGVVTAGQTAENIRQQTSDKTLSLGQAGAAIGAGIGTSALGAIGGKIASKLGIGDIDTYLASRQLAETSNKGIIRRIVEGGISEGVFEEMPQSMQEQVWMNAATGKDLLEGVKEAGATGLLTGAAMGGGVNVFTSGAEVDTKSNLTPEEQQLADIDKQISDKINSVKPEEMTTEFFAELNSLEEQRANLKNKPIEDKRYEQPLSDDLDTINRQIANLEASGRDTIETKNLLNELYNQKENLTQQIEDAPWIETQKEIERQQRVRDYPNKVQSIQSDETLTEEEKTNQLSALEEQYNQDYKPRDFAAESRSKIQKNIEKLSTGTFVPADQAELDAAMDDLMSQYEQLAKEETDVTIQENILNNQKRVVELDKQVKELQEQKPLAERTNIENRFNVLSTKENQIGLSKNEKTELTTLKGKLTKDNNRIAAIEKLNQEMSQLFTDTDEALSARFQRDFDIQRQERQDQQEYQRTLYDNAKTFVQGQERISPRGLMGQFDLTYQEAQQVLQSMEEEGIVGPAGKANIRNVGSASEQPVQQVANEEVTTQVEEAPNFERKTTLQDEISARQSEISDITDELEANRIEQSRLGIDDPMLAELKRDEENLNKSIKQKNTVLGLLQNRLDRGKFEVRQNPELISLQEDLNKINAELNDPNTPDILKQILSRRKEIVTNRIELAKFNYGNQTTSSSNIDYTKNSSGEDLIGYHGTQAEPFKAFDNNRIQQEEHGWAGAGHYFTLNKDYAKGYADQSYNSEGTKGRIVEARFSFKNPLYKYSPEYNKILKDVINSTSIKNKEEGLKATEAFKAAGYDAVIEGTLDNALEINVFDSKNIHYAPGKSEFETRSNTEPGQGISLSSIQKMYPNQEVFQSKDGKISVKFKNGLGATFQDVQDIGDGYIQLAIDTGQMDKNGLILGITQGNQVMLHKDYADDRTLWHENKHVLDNLNMITQDDNSALTKEFNRLRKAGKLEFGLSTHENPMRAMEENIANTFAQVMTSREQYRDTALGKFIQKIMDFFDRLLSFGQQTIRGLAQEFESGKIYERPTIELEQATETPQFKNVGNINSEEFKSWFGKSVAKKKTGEPVPFYHGSPNEFTIFEDRPAASTQKTAAGLGHFFTMDRNYAAGYSKGSGNLIEAYLKMEKPYKMSLDEADKFTTVQQAVNRKNELKSKGYDSIILQIPGTQPIITVFDSNQVKSTKNRGTWDINNPDINFQTINPSDINTQAFKDWFGDSKVVNNEGQPLVVYQGRSTKGLNVLQNPKGDVWATDVKESAENFADIQERYYPNRPKDQQVEREMRGEIYPLYMNLQNPKTISHKITLWNPTKEAEQISLAKQEGYDGLIIQHDNGKKDFVAFNPNQVKSIFNRGTWDKKYPNINFEVRQKFAIPEQEISQAEYDRMRVENRNIVGKVKQFMRSKGHEVNRTMNKYLGMTSTNLAKIHPMLQAKVRRLDFDTLQRIHNNLNDALPVLEAVNGTSVKKGMSKNDKSDWDWAVKNGDAGKILSLANKYNFTEQYQTLRSSLDQIHKDLIDVGYKPGFVDTYWPRLLKDREGFLQATREISRDPVFTQALQEKANKLNTSIENLDPDMRAEIIGQKIMEIKSGIGGPANIQGRVYDKIPPDLGKYYMDSSASLVQYIYSTSKNIEARKFFGRVPTKISNAQQIVRRGYNKLIELNNTYDLLASQDRDTADIRSKIKEVKDNIKLSEELIENYGQTRDFTENIGSYIDELRTNKLVKQDDEATLKDILSARFHERGTSGIANIYKNVSLLDTMGSPISALTQIQDLGWSIYVGGLTPSGITNTVRNISKAIGKRSDISKEDLGIEWIAQEFADADTFSRAVNKVFKITGLNYVDSIGKESLINNSYDNYKVKAKDRSKLFKEIRHMFSSDNETNQVITDLQNNNRDSKNVQFLVFSRLLDFQPASKSEMPEKMLTAGNWRLAYLLKTFTLKQFDIFRRDVWHKLKSGNRDQIIEGLQNMAYLTSIMTLTGAGADELKDFFLGKEAKFEDHVIENFLTLGGANRYIRMQVNREGIGTALGKQILPPFKFVDSIYKDVSNNVTDLHSARFVDSIPIGGKLYYWHLGKGAEMKQSIAEQDFKKEGKDVRKFKERLDKAADKRAFIQANISEFQTVRRHENMQGNLNKITALINKLKKVPQTANVTQRINQLESRKEQMYQRYGKYIN